MRRAVGKNQGSEEGTLSRLLDKKKMKILVTPHYPVLFFCFILLDYVYVLFATSSSRVVLVLVNLVVTLCSLLC